METGEERRGDETRREKTRRARRDDTRRHETTRDDMSETRRDERGESGERGADRLTTTMRECQNNIVGGGGPTMADTVISVDCMHHGGSVDCIHHGVPPGGVPHEAPPKAHPPQSERGLSRAQIAHTWGAEYCLAPPCLSTIH